jgi:acyl-CoA synthetase (AMP-forming)/AMP-acid ligase II
VKVRGYRVEPAEIEAAMRQGGAVDAVVVHRVTSVGTNELVGYFTSASELDAAALREALRTRLPAYLLPAYLVALDRLPLTPNGKVDSIKA